MNQTTNPVRVIFAVGARTATFEATDVHEIVTGSHQIHVVARVTDVQWNLLVDLQTPSVRQEALLDGGTAFMYEHGAGEGQLQLGIGEYRKAFLVHLQGAGVGIPRPIEATFLITS